MVASRTFPGRTIRMYHPISSAMGIVAPTVNVPQGLLLRALVTTNPRTAMRMTIIIRMPTSATKPPRGLISSLAICPSDLPSRRRELPSTQKSCTAPPRTTPARIHRVPGR